MFGVRWADDAERVVLQVRELRKYKWVQLSIPCERLAHTLKIKLLNMNPFVSYSASGIHGIVGLDVDNIISFRWALRRLVRLPKAEGTSCGGSPD